MAHTNPTATIGRPARSAPRTALSLAAAALALGSCELAEEPPAPALPPEGAANVPEEFASHRELAQAVRDHAYSERVELPEIEVAAPATPERVTVRFTSGTAIAEDQLPPLRELADEMLTDDSLRLSLIGCSDTSGAASLNQRISLERAKSVAAALEGLGVPKSRIDEVEGRGEDCDEPERAVHVIPERTGATAA